jgi:hypothetical protein
MTTVPFYKRENIFIREVRRHPEFVEKTLSTLSGMPMTDNPRVAGVFNTMWMACVKDVTNKSGKYYDKYVFLPPEVKQKTIMWKCEVLLQHIIDDYPDATSMKEFEHWGPVVETYKLYKQAMSS